MNDLWDFIEEPDNGPREAARSKRPQPLDEQPSQQRMRAQVKPAQRRNITPSEQKVRRQQARQQSQPKTAAASQHTAGYPDISSMSDDDLKSFYMGISPDASYEMFTLKDRLADALRSRGIDLADIPVDYFAQDFPNGVPLVSSQQSSIDQHHTTTSQKETTMDSSTFAHEEAALLQRMASAPTAFEQQEAAEALDRLRTARREALASDGFLDMDAALNYDGAGVLGDAIAPMSRAQSSLGRTSSVIVREGSGDWLDDIETMETVSGLDRDQEMQTEAALWYAEVHPVLKGDREEFSRQARSVAASLASPYLDLAPHAAHAFLDAVDHIHTHAGYQPVLRTAAPTNNGDTGWAGTDPLAPSPTTPVQTGDHGFGSGSSLPVGVSPAQNPQTADGLVNGDLPNASGQTDQKSTDSDRAPSLDRGSAPDTGTQPSGPDNPIAFDKTLDHSTNPNGQGFETIDPYPSGGTGNAATGAARTAADLVHASQPYAGGSPKHGDTDICYFDDKPIEFFDGAWYHYAGDRVPNHPPGVHPATPKERAEKSSSLGEDAVAAQFTGGRRITSANDWAQHTADGGPDNPAGPNASGLTDPKDPADLADDVPSMDHGSMPDTGTAATPGQVDGTPSGDLDKGNTPQNPDYVPTGGSGGNPATSGPMQGTPTTNGGTVTGLREVAAAFRAQVGGTSQNAVTFMAALEEVTSLDQDFGGVTAREIVGFVLEDTTVPEQVKAALRQAVVPPFVREGDYARNPQGNPDLGWIDPPSKSPARTEFERVFPNGVPLKGDLTEEQEQALRMRGSQHTAEGTSVGLSDDLLEQAEQAYDRNDQQWFDDLPTGVLEQMWALCTNIETCPAWDDEVYDALAARGHFGSKSTIGHTAASGDAMPPGSVRITPKDPQNSPGLINVVQVWSPMTAQTVYSGYDYSKALAVATEAIAKAKNGEWAEECKDARLYNSLSVSGARRRSNDFSISDAKNEEGEWTMSPEEIRAEMNYDPSEDYDPYGDDYEASLHTAESKAKPTNITQHQTDRGDMHQRATCENCGGGLRRQNSMASGWVHTSTNTKYCPTKTGAKTGAVYVEYNEFGGVKHSIPADEFLDMVANPQNGWHAEPEFEGSPDYWATGPEGTGHRYTYVAAKQAGMIEDYRDLPEAGTVVTIHDMRTLQSWQGVVEKDGLIHDSSGYIEPNDIGFRYHIEPMPAGTPTPSTYLAPHDASRTAARDTGTCTCGRAISYDSSDRKWTHDSDGSPAHGKQASKEDEGFYDHTPAGGWCPQCTGTGRVDESGDAANADGPRECPSCHGSGRRTGSRKVAWLDAAQRVVDNHQHEEVDGHLLDATTAHLLTSIHKALGDEAKKKFEAMPLHKAVDVAWKLHSRTSASLTVQGISLTNVGIEGPGVGTGTTSDGTKVRFRLSPADEASLRSVLFSDLAGNFSGVDIGPDEIISEQGGGNSMNGPSRNPAAHATLSSIHAAFSG